MCKDKPHRYTVGFDPGLNLGWSKVLNGKYIESGHYKNDAQVDIKQRQLELSSLIDDLIRNAHVTTVAVEGVNRVKRNKKVQTESNQHTWAMYWIYGEIMRLSTIYGKEFVSINPMSMKAAMTSGKRDKGKKGCAKKAEVAKIIKSEITDKKMRFDESDAIGIAITDWKLYTGQYTPKKGKKK